MVKKWRWLGLGTVLDVICKRKDARKRQGKVFALDCEMVLTSKGREVARVALLDFSGETCLDELVKPENQIWNYNTKYSGITKDTLRGLEESGQDCLTCNRVLEAWSQPMTFLSATASTMT